MIHPGVRIGHTSLSLFIIILLLSADIDDIIILL